MQRYMVPLLDLSTAPRSNTLTVMLLCTTPLTPESCPFCSSSTAAAPPPEVIQLTTRFVPSRTGSGTLIVRDAASGQRQASTDDRGARRAFQPNRKSCCRLATATVQHCYTAYVGRDAPCCGRGLINYTLVKNISSTVRCNISYKKPIMYVPGPLGWSRKAAPRMCAPCRNLLECQL